MELLRKLNVKDQKAVLVINPPEEFKHVLALWKDVLSVHENSPIEPHQFVLIFAKDKAQLEQIKPTLKTSMDPGGLIWVSYPKKSSKLYTSDLSRDDFWDAFKELGLEPVRQVALDEDWSALRFKPSNAIKRK